MLIIIILKLFSISLNDPFSLISFIFIKLLIYFLKKILKSNTFYICNGCFNILVNLLGNFSNYKFTVKTAKIFKYIFSCIL